MQLLYNFPFLLVSLCIKHAPYNKKPCKVQKVQNMYTDNNNNFYHTLQQYSVMLCAHVTVSLSAPYEYRRRPQPEFGASS